MATKKRAAKKSTGYCGVEAGKTLRAALDSLGVRIDGLTSGDWNYLGGFIFSGCMSIAEKQGRRASPLSRRGAAGGRRHGSSRLCARGCGGRPPAQLCNEVGADMATKKKNAEATRCARCRRVLAHSETAVDRRNLAILAAQRPMDKEVASRWTPAHTKDRIETEEVLKQLTEADAPAEVCDAIWARLQVLEATRQ